MNGLALTKTRKTYSAEHFEPLFEAESRHFWFKSRNRCIAAATRLITNPDAVESVIEHGCGTGFVLAELQRLFPKARVVGADLFAEGLALARRRFNGPLAQVDLLQCDYREAFDLIGLFDVLEHLDDDLRVLRALREQLRPGGCLMVTVPAHMMLWSNFDVVADHRRRYKCSQLKSRLVEAGFQVTYCTEFMLALFPLMLVKRRLSWGRAETEGKQMSGPAWKNSDLRPHSVLNGLLKLVLWPEPWWIRRGWRLPWGTSILALATRNAC
jgi:SAM-dependent methyltransferase